MVQSRSTVEGEEAPAEDSDENPFFWSRPTACSIRRAVPNDALIDFQRWKGELPTCRPPGPGYCWSSLLHPWNLLCTIIRMIWDGGAEGISISGMALSRVLRNQKAAGRKRLESPNLAYGPTTDFP